jgi:hypothetical protein
MHLVVTSDRVAMITEWFERNWLGSRTKRVYEIETKYLLWGQIARVSLEPGQLQVTGKTGQLDSLYMHPDGRESIDGVPPFDPKEFSALGIRIRTYVDQLHISLASETPATDTLIEKLERLAKLRQSGALDEEEFRAAKRKLLLD